MYALCSGMLLVSMLLVATNGCDSILPEDFKNKEYTIAEIDQRACNLLSADTVNNAQGVTIGYKSSSGHPVQSRLLASLVDSATRANNRDNQIIFSSFNLLADSLALLVSDSLMLITHPSASQKDTTYAVMKILPGQSQNIYLYTSLRYYDTVDNVGNHSTNINDYVSVELVRVDTTTVNYSEDMHGETISGGTQIILMSQQKHVVPIIRARYKIQLDQSIYIVRLIISSPATIRPFKIVILPV
jgi:hypothetical protein